MNLRRAALPKVAPVAPGVKWSSAAPVAPPMCCALVTGMSGVSYHPRAANDPSWKFSWNSTVPPPGTPPPPLPPPADDELVVTPVATFERAPNTAFTLSVPRYATSSKLWVVPADKPRTVQVRVAPTDVPTTGAAHVPRDTLGVPPHGIVALATYRTS